MDNYNFFEKFVHAICLGNKYMPNIFFDIEKLIFLKNSKELNQVDDKKHIFISGLARSGTTILLQVLYSSNKFASLTYQDMPFIFAPNLFNKLNISENINLRERIHGDRILYDLKTPEAFDEVFFKNINDTSIQNYKKLIFLILKKNNKDHYISKNNYNYKRIKSINENFKKSLVLIPLRNPLDHAISLYEQHQKFLILQTLHPFILKYMNYLGHYEFGKNYKPWNKSIRFIDHNDVNHWLEQWLLFYKNIENILNNNNKIIIYEKMCNDLEYQKKIINETEVDFNKVKLNNLKFLRKDISKYNFENSLKKETDLIYSKLKNNKL